MAAALKHDGIEAWYMDESMEDHRLPHHRKPKLFVSSDQLKDLGVLSWQLNKEEDKFDDDLKLFCESKGYCNQFLIELSPEKLPNYEVLIEKFYEEHLHTVEEVHYIVEGSGYFDVRDESDSWIRIAAKKGSIISLPAGIYHRFSLDTTNYIKVIQLSVGEAKLAAYRRPSDGPPARKE